MLLFSRGEATIFIEILYRLLEKNHYLNIVLLIYLIFSHFQVEYGRKMCSELFASTSEMIDHVKVHHIKVLEDIVKGSSILEQYVLFCSFKKVPIFKIL